MSATFENKLDFTTVTTIKHKKTSELTSANLFLNQTHMREKVRETEREREREKKKKKRERERRLTL